MGYTYTTKIFTIHLKLRFYAAILLFEVPDPRVSGKGLWKVRIRCLGVKSTALELRQEVYVTCLLNDKNTESF